MKFRWMGRAIMKSSSEWSRAPGRLSRLSIRLLVSAQVMIARLVCLSPAWGSVLIARSLLEILSFHLSLSLSAPPLLAFSCFLMFIFLREHKQGRSRGQEGEGGRGRYRERERERQSEAGSRL